MEKLMVSTQPKSLVIRSNDLHKIAVVLPVYATSQGYARMVVEAVDALSQQTRQPDLVLVVDDFSPVPLPESIARTVSNGRDSRTTEIRVLKLPYNCGPAAARNEGLVTAKREGASLVLFLDSDCLPDRSWVEAMEETQIQSPGIVCGRTLSFEKGSVVGFYHDVCGTLNGRVFQDSTVLYGCTCNLSIDTSKVGFYFDTTFRRAAFEDVEFCVRARKKDIKLTYTSKAVMKHRYEPGWWGLFRQFQRYGSFEKQMCLKHPEYLGWLWSSESIPSIQFDYHGAKTVLISGMWDKAH
ncbi:hypothetical protein R1sor_023728 [Riccia sorocarpa]|uniref:Glycosyltransferase 2-like domain-containing protein n=1 Tax=Riccia sorocarpa TaxID=122646 RepID=A0ABD3GQM4_9MARC